MKKLVLTGLALVAGAALSYAQGTISINAVANTAVTKFRPTVRRWQESVHILAALVGLMKFWIRARKQRYTGLTSGQQAGVYNLIANQSDFSLWTGCRRVRRNSR